MPAYNLICHSACYVQVSPELCVRNNIFAHGINGCKMDLINVSSPSASSLIEVSRDTYREIVIDKTNFQKAMLPKFLDYYTTSSL